ncbi:MAG: hypothetical protein ACYTEI_12095 [Planctomycetota bacterium]|jgi:hypothetical protein
MPLCAALLALGGCGQPADPGGSDGGPPRVGATTEHGPVSMTVWAEPGEITVGGRVKLTIEVTAPEGIEVRMPQLEDTVGAFAVRAAHTPPDVPEGGRRRFAHTYELDTFAAGDVEIPAVSVRFTDRRPEVDETGQGLEGELAGEPLMIRVGSVLAGTEQPTDFRDIKSPVDVPVDSPLAARWLLWAAVIVVAGAAAAAVAIVMARRRRRRTAAERNVGPHEWASAQLDALARERLIEESRFHEFYFRLTDIVRQYIERRFSIMAPEQTTDEFLVQARTSPVLSDEHKDVLGGFLRAADMVKFARHQPTADEAGRAFAGARTFVDETAPAETGPDAVEEAA